MNKHYLLFFSLLSLAPLSYSAEEAVSQQENQMAGAIVSQHYTILDVMKIMKIAPTILCQKKALFVQAIEQGDLALVQFLTQFCFCDLNEQYRSHGINARRSEFLPLEIALYKNQSRVFRFLLQHGAEIKPSSIDESDTLLHVAADLGNTDVLKVLIDSGVQLDAENRMYDTPLHRAARARHLEAVQWLWNAYNERLSEERKQKLLIGREKKNDQDIFVPVTMPAVGRGSIDIMRFLISQGARIDSKFVNFLSEALWGNHYAMFRFLVEQGAPLDTPSHSALLKVCSSSICNKIDMVKFLVDHGARLDTSVGSPVLEACKKGDLELVKYLLDAGAPLETHFGSPLMEACGAGDSYSLVKYLITEKHVDVNAAVDVEDFPEPMAAVFAADKPEILSLLLSHGADISRRANGKYLIHYCAMADDDDLEVVEILFRHDRNVIYTLDDMKNSPLHLAAEEGNVSIACFLLDVMNPEKMQELNSRNRTPLMCALWSLDSNPKCKEIVKYCIERFRVNGIEMTELERRLFTLKIGGVEGVHIGEGLPEDAGVGYA